MSPFEQPNTVWRYPLEVAESFTIQMPAGSIPLSVAMKDGEPCVWVAVCSFTERQEAHRFRVFGTGQWFPTLLTHRFIGTFQMPELGLVWHVFDGGPEATQE